MAELIRERVRVQKAFMAAVPKKPHCYKKKTATAYMTLLPQHVPYIGSLFLLYLTTGSYHFLLVCLSYYHNPYS
jgi:hypothetical protein